MSDVQETPSEEVIVQPTPIHKDLPDISMKRGPGRPTTLRTGKRGRPTKIYNLKVNHATDDTKSKEDILLNDIDINMNASEIQIDEAINGPDSEEWFNAIYSEIKCLVQKDTWEIVDRPVNENVIGCRTILRNKYNSDGTIQRRKARVVAKGFAQRPGIDFMDTFAPVARIESFRLLIALAAKYNLHISQLDITTAYLNGDIDTLLFMETPDLLKEALLKMVDTEKDDVIRSKAINMLIKLESDTKVCKLHKAIYGLRQSGLQWHAKLSGVLKSFGLKPINSDPYVYIDDQEEFPTIVLVYVDDILIASQNTRRIEQIKTDLSSTFEVRDIGQINYCLGIAIVESKNKITLCQRGYIKDVLHKYNMENCKAVKTPLATGVKLQLPMVTEGENIVRKQYPYRELIGALMYIAYAVNMLSQFNNCHNESHWQAAKRILRYLQGTIGKKLVYICNNEGISGFADADWGNCNIDRKFILSGAAISWCARKQRTVALSSTEAEYMSLTDAAKEAIFLSTIVKELGFEELSKITIYNDNQSAGKLALNPVFHSRSKHIDIKFHFIRQALQDHPLKLEYLSTEDMIADVFTKPLSGFKHEKCVLELGVNSE